ncbi:hypothetical protein KM043_002144 [Ampulex compressa]|nr:hypothetical protein KM043_002144 [Ampulex compressa]
MQHKLNCIGCLHTPISPVSHGHRAVLSGACVRLRACAWVGFTRARVALSRASACAKIGIARGLPSAASADTDGDPPLSAKNTTHPPPPADYPPAAPHRPDLAPAPSAPALHSVTPCALDAQARFLAARLFDGYSWIRGDAADRHDQPDAPF